VASALVCARWQRWALAGAFAAAAMLTRYDLIVVAVALGVDVLAARRGRMAQHPVDAVTSDSGRSLPFRELARVAGRTLVALIAWMVIQ
jgi:hypothetical protein